jgi:hypothetical protein
MGKVVLPKQPILVLTATLANPRGSSQWRDSCQNFSFRGDSFSVLTSFFLYGTLRIIGKASYLSIEATPHSPITRDAAGSIKKYNLKGDDK